MAQTAPMPAQAGIDGFPGPFAVGRYAERLRARVREFASVCVIGEATGVRVGRGPNVYFELRDADGALPCAMWRDDFDRSGLAADAFRDGVEVVAAGGCDYYAGSATSSPRFSFRVVSLRLAGEGDLLARLARLRRRLAEEGVFEPQKRLPRTPLPRRIGVVTGEGSAAARDVLAGLGRRGWRGTLVWAHAPVQDRRAAPAIAARIRDLAAYARVETIVVARGGGSIADLWAFCDETLCRTVALCPVPVISAVGHDVDRTLIDDAAAVCCSTPTHAAEEAVRVDCGAARAGLARSATRIELAGRGAVVTRARALAAYSRAPREQVLRHRRALHQFARELRATWRRGRETRAEHLRRVGGKVLVRRVDATRVAVAAAGGELTGRVGRLDRSADVAARRARLGDAATGLMQTDSLARRSHALAAHAAALRAHDPQRTIERGYALLVGPDGDAIASATQLRRAGRFEARLADGAVGAVVDEEAPGGN